MIRHRGKDQPAVHGKVEDDVAGVIKSIKVGNTGPGVDVVEQTHYQPEQDATDVEPAVRRPRAPKQTAVPDAVMNRFVVHQHLRGARRKVTTHCGERRRACSCITLSVMALGACSAFESSPTRSVVRRHDTAVPVANTARPTCFRVTVGFLRKASATAFGTGLSVTGGSKACRREHAIGTPKARVPQASKAFISVSNACAMAHEHAQALPLWLRIARADCQDRRACNFRIREQRAAPVLQVAPSASASACRMHLARVGQVCVVRRT